MHVSVPRIELGSPVPQTGVLATKLHRLVMMDDWRPALISRRRDVRGFRSAAAATRPIVAWERSTLQCVSIGCNDKVLKCIVYD